MKLNYKIATLAFSCAVTFSSCADFLDEKPYGQFTSDQIDDTSIEGLMAAAYAGLEAHFFGNNESFTAPVSNWVFDVRSDDAYKGGGGVSMEASIHQLEISNLTSDNPTGVNKWKNNYYYVPTDGSLSFPDCEYATNPLGIRPAIRVDNRPA